MLSRIQYDEYVASVRRWIPLGTPEKSVMAFYGRPHFVADDGSYWYHFRPKNSEGQNRKIGGFAVIYMGKDSKVRKISILNLSEVGEESGEGEKRQPAKAIDTRSPNKK